MFEGYFKDVFKDNNKHFICYLYIFTFMCYSYFIYLFSIFICYFTFILFMYGVYYASKCAVNTLEDDIGNYVEN